ncbi:MAG: DUF616 domain-containing protein [Lachnospiraceae bacterium]|nr:DUF616 domain-containing protein [Lachnospiraceae bacterium]
MSDKMGVEELQQIVSICLDEIEGLKQQNQMLVEAVKQLTVKVGQQDQELEQKYTQLRQRMYGFQCQDAYQLNREKLLLRGYLSDDASKVPFTGKGVVYSAMTGNYDTVKEIQYKNPHLDYILFTDNPNVRSSTWEVRLLENSEGLDSVRLARKAKILGHALLADYDYSVWVDAKLEVVGDFEEYIQRYRGKRPLLCFPNFTNDCAYEEEKLCEALKKDRFDTMRAQMQKYQKEGYPAHNGMVETAILVREIHNEEVIKVMETWWNEIINHSYRDQLSFNYSCWKCDFLYDFTNLLIYMNDYVVLHAHN